MPRKKKNNKVMVIGSMVVSVGDADGSGNIYEMTTTAGKPWFPKWQEWVEEKTLVLESTNEETGEESYKTVPKKTKLTGCGTFRRFVWDIFEDTEGSKMSSYINFWIMGLIVLSAVVAIVETIPALHKSQETLWFWLETFFVANFSIEFICRVCSTPDFPEFCKTVMNYVDLIAILPFYIDIFAIIFSSGGGGPNFGFLRILRLGRAFRLVKLSKYSQGIRLVTNAMVNSIDALQLFALLLILVLVVFSSGIYYTERGEWVGSTCTDEWIAFYGSGNLSKPGVIPCLPNRYYRIDNRVTTAQKGIEQYPSPFQSIPQSFWWCIVTLTTVGYGDMYPYTDIGKTVGVLTMLVGLIMLALPLSIIGTNFIEERNIMVEENKRRDKEALEDEKRRLGQTLAEPDTQQVSVRKDLRELLAKADQLYENSGTMVKKLTECQQLLHQMRTTMVKTPPLPGPASGSATGPGGSGSGTGTEVPLEEARDSSAVTISPLPTMYAVPTAVIEDMKSLCLEVLKSAITEMKIWDPDGELPDMPKQISTLLAQESKKCQESGMPDNKIIIDEEDMMWKKQLLSYESVSPHLQQDNK